MLRRCSFFLLLWTLGSSTFSEEGAPVAADQVACVACKGSGVCPEPGCESGQTVCPRTCLKKEGPWKKVKVEGHGDNELWQEFKGQTQGKMWTQAHIGELIEFENGDPVNKGACPTCNRTGKISCTLCAGTDVCVACGGTKLMTKEQKKTWEKQAKSESIAKAALESLRADEAKAGEKKDRLVDIARGFMAISKKFPDTRAGQQAKLEAERLAEKLKGK
jgi:hypothetical protein